MKQNTKKIITIVTCMLFFGHTAHPIHPEPEEMHVIEKIDHTPAYIAPSTPEKQSTTDILREYFESGADALVLEKLNALAGKKSSPQERKNSIIKALQEFDANDGLYHKASAFARVVGYKFSPHSFLHDEAYLSHARHAYNRAYHEKRDLDLKEYLIGGASSIISAFISRKLNRLLYEYTRSNTLTTGLSEIAPFMIAKRVRKAVINKLPKLRSQLFTELLRRKKNNNKINYIEKEIRAIKKVSAASIGTLLSTGVLFTTGTNQTVDKLIRGTLAAGYALN